MSEKKQARKPRNYASSKLRPTKLLAGVKCRVTSVAKNLEVATKVGNIR